MEGKVKHIILIGFMGAGKTSIGRHLARKMRRDFVDSDLLIEEQAHMKVADIFKEYGESYFRDLETLTLRQLLAAERPMVIAVGGGLPMREENREYLKELGTVVYLRAEAKTIMKRLSGDTKRPLLQGAKPEEKILALMEERDPIYEEIAEVKITTDNKNHNQIVEEVQKYV